MTYPTESFAGAAVPTYVQTTFSASATSATFHSLTTWTELGTANPLGTSGDFVIVVDFGKSTEEKIRCSALNSSTGVITFVQRGYDDTTPAVHSAGLAGTPNCFPVLSASDIEALQDRIETVSGVASSAQSAANAKVASVTATNGTIVVGGTATAPTVGVGTVPYSSLSGTPSALPPSGAAGGDLTGTYPNPTLAAAGTAGTYGSSTAIPVVTTDSKGRVTSVTTQAPNDAAKLPLTGGTLTGALNGTTATFTGEAKGSDFAPTGLTGATAATRYVGGTTNGAPISGTFAVGDFVVDQTATVWVCVVAGTPGTWSTTISSHLVLRSATATASRNETTIFTGSTSGQTLSAPGSPVDGSTWTVANKSSVNVTLSFSANSMIPLGSSSSVTSYTVSPQGTYSFINYNAGQWYMIATNGADHLVDYSSVPVSNFGAATANVAMGANKITGLANGTTSTDAATFGQIPASLPPSGAAGGDITGTYPNPTLATAYAGASPVGSATAVPVLTVDTKGRITASSTAAPLDATKLPLAGGTMSGTLTMGTNRITGLALPTAATDVPRVIDVGAEIGPYQHIDSFGVSLKGWSQDPYLVNSSNSPTSSTVYFIMIRVPYAVTLTGVKFVIQTAGTTVTAGNIGLYDSTTLLASTGTSAGLSAFQAAAGSITAAFSSTVAVNAGIYWIGFYVTATTTPAMPRYTNTNSTITNPNIAAATNTLTLRSSTLGSGSLPSTISGTPTAAALSYYMAVY